MQPATVVTLDGVWWGYTLAVHNIFCLFCCDVQILARRSQRWNFASPLGNLTRMPWSTKRWRRRTPCLPPMVSFGVVRCLWGRLEPPTPCLPLIMSFVRCLWRKRNTQPPAFPRWWALVLSGACEADLNPQPLAFPLSSACKAKLNTQSHLLNKPTNSPLS